MNGRRSPDDIIRDWIAAGPEMASSVFVEQTLTPVPRMRQHRPWRVRLSDVTRPVTRPAQAAAGLAVVLVLVAGALLLRLPGGVGPAASPSPSPARPSFELHTSGGPGEGTYLSDPTTTLATCSTASDGSWRLLYGGGDPFVNLDLLVGGAARQPDGASYVAAEIEINGARPDYVRFDPMKMRGGDPPGRSTATVAIEDGPGTITFRIHATTPERITGIDGNPIDIDLTVTCPT